MKSKRKLDWVEWVLDHIGWLMAIGAIAAVVFWVSVAMLVINVADHPDQVAHRIGVFARGVSDGFNEKKPKPQ